MQRSHCLDIYSIWVHVATSAKDWDALSESKDLGLSDPGTALGMTQHATQDLPGGVERHHICFYLNRKAFKTRSLAVTVETVAHEAVHGAGMVLSIVEHEVEDLGGDEPFAYLAGWLTQWLFKAVRST